MFTEAREALREQLKRHEGLVLRAYDDRSGFVIAPGSYQCLIPGDSFKVGIGCVTIGYGRNLFGRGITATEAELLLSADISDTLMELDELIPWWLQLDPARQIVVAGMAFNLGATRLVKDWPNFMGALQRKEYGRAAVHMRKSLWYRQVGRRADDLVQQMESGRLPA
jgi:lysozyme